MKTFKAPLPTTELKPETGAVFTNGDESAAGKNLTRKNVAEMAFQNVFSDWITLEAQEPGSIRRMLLG